MKLEFIDLKKQYQHLKPQIDEQIQMVLDNGDYILGKQVTELETKLANFVEVKHCITCSNGTDALAMALMAYDIGEGDAVFTASFTFFASAEVIALRGAFPVLVDCDKDTFNISPKCLEEAIKKTLKVTKSTPKAVIAVDLFGLPADYDEINRICKKYNLILIEDGAQGFGGEYKGNRACSFGDVATTSFFPAKPLGCYGDGGAIFTNNDELASILRSIRVHGKGKDKYDNVRIGLNARLDTIQAGVLLAKLDEFENEIEKRQVVALEYTKRLKDFVKTPLIPEGYKSVYAQYTLTMESTEQREFIMDYLKQAGIPSIVYYVTPIHAQTSFKKYGYEPNDCPISSDLSNRVMSIPMHPYLETDQIEFICETIIEGLKKF